MRMHVNVRTLCLLIVDISLACSAGGDSDDDKKKSKDPGRQDESGEIKGPTGPTKPVPTMKPSPEECDLKPEAIERIVNGEPAMQAELPWQVRLVLIFYKTDSQGLCGGTLISPVWVVSAGHCFQPRKTRKAKFKFKETTAILGDTADLSDEVCEVKVPHCKTVIVHGGFDPDTFKDDISVVKLSLQVHLNAHVNVATLPSRKQSIAGTLVVSGFGRIREEIESSALELRKANVLEVPYKLCKSTMDQLHKKLPGYVPELPKNIICALAQNKTHVMDSCKGDSGGPLALPKVDQDPFSTNEAVLVGVVSYGYHCGQRNVPGIYTDVRQYRHWIKKKTGV